ncbi:MAG TPA: sugar ABC transporter permease [Thermotogota bacterium]|nr:sugar ABC transporter permease [Thermotogota bacterium]HPJ88798.1 sugar ABC transporter permease [Thermotogota bacterium]HPR97297.1 sugar ABC transporter permease [Thermotogota bacterium]
MNRQIKRRGIVGYGFIAPALVFYAIFFGFPVVFSLLASFKRWNMLTPFSEARFVGFKHYIYLFENELFMRALLNTCLYALITVPVTIFLALIFANLIHHSKFPALWRFLYFTPIVTPPVAIGTIWNYLYRPNNGILNQLLGFFGLKPIYWLTDPNTVLFSVMITAVWAGIGSSLLIFSAGIQNIPQAYYDAAEIDGAGPIVQFWKITVPMLRPSILFLTATGMITAWQVFDLPFIMGKNAPSKSIMTISGYVYETAFQSVRMGRASAGAFILFVVIFIVTLFILRAFKKGGINGYE